jgi:hypothetical protein
LFRGAKCAAKFAPMKNIAVTTIKNITGFEQGSSSGNGIIAA